MTKEELEKKYLLIPQEMKIIKRWICYNIERDTKLPINALNGKLASTSDPLTWTSFNLAINGCVKYNCTGLGFILGEDKSTGVTYFGVDLDNHIDKVTGKKPFESAKDFEEFANIFIDGLDSYTEYSHSLEGVHIICKGKLPVGARKRKGVEMYDYRRFFTMTGKVINNVSIKERTEEVKPLWEKYLNTETEEEKNLKYKNAPLTELQPVKKENGKIVFEEVEVIETSPSNLTDYELIEKIRNSQQGADFMALLNGDMSAYGNDHSSADLALCKILAFWTGCDISQMDRIFRNSKLMRDKWDQKRSATNRKGVQLSAGTYGSQTIEYAIANQYEAYVPPKEKITIKARNDTKVVVGSSGDVIEFDEKNDPVVNIKKIFNKSYSLTDTGNAQRFYDYFGGYFRYNSTDKVFMFWNNKTWINDNKNYVKKFADLIIDILKEEIKETEARINEISSEYKEKAEDADTVNESIEIKMAKSSDVDIKQYEAILKAQRDNLKRVSNSSGKEAMIKEFQHLHEIAIEQNELDIYPNFLNTESGVVNLDNGEIMPFDKKLKLSKNTNVAVSYEEPKTWLKFLKDIFKRPNEAETDEIINIVQMALGESLTGRTNKDHLFILYGNGSNGKSTFIKTVNKCFGDYGKTINSELLLQSKSSNPQATEFSFAALKGARILTMSETNESEKMNDKIIKQMTSGEEVAAQQKFGRSFSYEPTYSPWMSTNNLPVIRSKDYGIWRRIYLIPFLNTFTEETKDIHMPEKLAIEMPRILGWMIKGLLKLNKEYAGVLQKPKCLEESLSDYKNQMDAINIYISSNCENFPGYETSAPALFKDYKTWALDNNEYLMPESKFKADMIKHGFKLKRNSIRGWVYVGIKMNKDLRGHIFEENLLDEEDE